MSVVDLITLVIVLMPLGSHAFTACNHSHTWARLIMSVVDLITLVTVLKP